MSSPYSANNHGGRSSGQRGARGTGRGQGYRGRGNNKDRVPQCFRCGGFGHTSHTCTSSQELKQKGYSMPPLPAHSIPFIDTHCHVDYMCEQARVATWSEFKEKMKNQLPDTYGGCITTYCDSMAILSSFSQFEDLVTGHPEVHHTFGLHPHNAKYWSEKIEEKISKMVSTSDCVGWGEIGMDNTSEKKGGSDEGEQIEIFLKQLELAKSVCPEKPIVIHFRGDGRLLANLLSSLPVCQKLHLHGWGDSDVDLAKDLLAAFPNLCFGLGGSIVSNFEMRSVVKAIPLDRILLETDGPYMLPKSLKPPRGRKILMPVNHPGIIPYIAQEIAEIKGIDIDDVLMACLCNTERVYGVTPFIQDGGNNATQATASTAKVSSSKVEKDATDGTEHTHMTPEALGEAQEQARVYSVSRMVADEHVDGQQNKHERPAGEEEEGVEYELEEQEQDEEDYESDKEETPRCPCHQ